MFGNSCCQGIAIEHIEYFVCVSYLHSGCSGIFITSNNRLPQTLSGDNKLFSQLSRAEQKDFLGHKMQNV